MSSPPIIPDHTLLRPIGRGAYGEVWLARNIMGAPRAIKIIWRHRFESDRPYEREFAGIQRYEPVSRMTDGLVHVLHIGRNEAEGYFYYVMELGDSGNEEFRIANVELTNKPATGPQSSLDTRHLQLYSPRTLRSDLKRFGRLPVADCLQLGLDVVSGLARLHQQGLVHRDVKPGNIIFVNGRAKLADIGLVSLGGEARTFVGTEGYIPPEGPGTPSADIFALGMVLYEAITGYSPDDFPKVPAEWFSDEPRNVNANPSLNQIEFHEIVLKACEGARERRYQTAEQMQADLALLQSGQSVRRTRALERRLARFRVLGIAAVVMLLLAIGAVLLANYRARIEARNSAKELGLRQRAEAAESEGRKQLYTALLREAHATAQSRELGQRTRALEAIRQAAAISNSTELRREVMAALSRPDLRFRAELSVAPETTIVSCDPSFQRVALGRGTNHIEIHSLHLQGESPGVLVPSVRSVLAMAPASANFEAHGCDWSPDGKWIAVRRDYPPDAAYATIEIWHVPSLKADLSPAAPALLRHDVPQGSVCFHPQSRQVMIAHRDGSAVVYNLDDNFQQVARLPLDRKPQRLKYAPDARSFTGAFDTEEGCTITVYDASNGNRLVSHSFEGSMGAIDWHPGGKWISVPHSSSAIYLIDVTQPAKPPTLLGHHKAQAANTVFTPDGNYLFTGGWERELICWDIAAMERSFTIPLGSFTVQFAEDSRQCAVMVHKGGVQLHSFEQPLQREFAEDLGGRLRRAVFSADGRWVGASGDKRCAVWDLANPGPGALLEEGAEAQLYFTPDAQELFLSHNSPDDDSLRWRLRPGTNSAGPPVLEPLPLTTPPGFTFLTLASNVLVLTSSEGSQLIPLSALNAPNPSYPLVPTMRGVSGLSPDGSLLGIYRPFSSSLYLYSLPSFERVAKLKHLTAIAGFQFHPTTDQLAIYSSRGLEFWSTKTWSHLQTLTNFNNIRFSRDGRGWWLTKDFRSAGLYHQPTTSEQPEPRLLLPAGMTPLAVSPDGENLAVTVDFRRLQLWNIAELRNNLRDLGIDWAD